jgi:hypothetical protein
MANTIIDISGNLKNGVVTNCINTKDGIMLMGVNSKVVFGNIGVVKSVSFRFKPLSATCKIMEKAANSGLIYNNSGTLVAADFANIYINGTVGTGLTVNQWHNVCLTSASDVTFSACTLGLNNATYGAFEIADLRFHNRTLNVQETKDYNNLFVRPVLVCDFSQDSADRQVKTPVGWIKGTGAGKIGELTSVVSTSLPKGKKYFEFTTAGTMSISISLDAYIGNGYVDYDYYNGSVWSHRSGLLTAPVIGIAYTASKITMTGTNIGDRFTNLVIRQGQII